MVRIKNQQVDYFVSSLDYLYVFLCIIMLGSATIYTEGGLENFGFGRGMGYASLVGKTAVFVLSLFLLHKHNIHLSQCFDNVIVFVILLFAILQYMKYGFLSTYSIVRLMNLYFASVLIFVYRNKFIYILEDVIYKLAFFDLVFWVLLVISPSLVEFLMGLSPILGSGLVEGNSWVVFAMGWQYEVFIRNIGFAWEPGRFGSIVVIGIFANIIVNNFRIKGNKHLSILILTLLSSQSTTSYMGFVFTIIVYIYNIRRKYFIYALPVGIIAIIILMNLDFMADKIQELSIFNQDHSDKFEASLDYYATTDQFVPQRFDALLLEGLNILHDPLIGNASDPSGYLYSVFNVNFSLSNGLLRIFANMGLAIGIMYYYLVYKASKWMSKEYNYNGWWAFMGLFMIINVSYSWIFEPVLLTFVLYPYIINKYSIQYETT